MAEQDRPMDRLDVAEIEARRANPVQLGQYDWPREMLALTAELRERRAAEADARQPEPRNVNWTGRAVRLRETFNGVLVGEVGVVEHVAGLDVRVRLWFGHHVVLPIDVLELLPPVPASEAGEREAAVTPMNDATFDQVRRLADEDGLRAWSHGGLRMAIRQMAARADIADPSDSQALAKLREMVEGWGRPVITTAVVLHAIALASGTGEPS